MGWESQLNRSAGKNDDDKTVDTVAVNAANAKKYQDIKEKVLAEIIDEFNKRFSVNDKPENIDAELREMISQLILKQEQRLTRLDESKLIQEVIDDVLGLGPLEPLLRDATISEIMVNNAKQIYVERKGKLELTPTAFNSDEHVLQVINRIVSAVGRRCDESTPLVDARLADGSRFNAVIPPIALKGPSMTIRKFSSTPLKIKDLISFGSMSPHMANFLEAAVKGKCNVIVSGGTGSGKTTLLNVLSSFINDNERIVTIEDAAELQLEQNHVVTLESRPKNIEGKGEILIRDLVKNALRMRPDRIVVGEVRGGETLDMLQAMNTGHDGSLTTLHANTPRDVMSRLETMVLMAGMELPARAIREQIAAAIDIVVHQSRLRDGTRKVVSITEVLGMEGDTITIQEIFGYKQDGIDGYGRISGQFLPTGFQPHIVTKIKNNGGLIKDEWFVNNRIGV